MKRLDICDKLFQISSYFLCFCFAVYFTIQCIQHYMLDEDVTQIEYRKFHDDITSIYPSVTYCINNPIELKENVRLWKKYGSRSSLKLRNEYVNYLIGFRKSNIFSESDYDILTKKLEDFLLKVEISFDSNTFATWEFKNGTFTVTTAFKKYITEHSSKKADVIEDLSDNEKQMLPTLKFYITRRSRTQKCYTFDVPFIANVRVNNFVLHLSPYSLFKLNEKKNSGLIKPKRYQHYFQLHFHYPHQKLLAMTSTLKFESLIDTALQYNLRHYLRNIEVLRRRDKRSEPCIAEKEYDEMILKETIEAFGCKLPNIYVQNNATICKGRKKSAKLFSAIFKKQHRPPCQRIQTINIVEKEFEPNFGYKKNNETLAKQIPRKLSHRIYFEDNYFKEMIYIKDYTFLSLFANAGGYIGK